GRRPRPSKRLSGNQNSYALNPSSAARRIRSAYGRSEKKVSTHTPSFTMMPSLSHEDAGDFPDGFGHLAAVRLRELRRDIQVHGPAQQVHGPGTRVRGVVGHGAAQRTVERASLLRRHHLVDEHLPVRVDVPV